MYIKNNNPRNYFLLVFVLSIPIWGISALLGNKLPIRVNLPISAILFICPVIAASILVYQQEGLRGVKDLLLKALDARKIKRKVWYAPILLLVPLIYFLSYVVMRWAGLQLPDPIETPFLLAPVFFIIYFFAAACEELGWTGYAIDSLQNRWGALTASLILGVVWQIWHIIGDLQAGNSLIWIIWHSLYSVALRILIVWMYNNTGMSVFAATLVHTMDNVSWSLFPNYGSGFNPLVAGVIAWLIAASVILAYGPKSLALWRFSQNGISKRRPNS
jgi:membrane protease YdiL (CAAX protease family)